MLKCLFRRCFSILAIVLGQDQRAALFGICNLRSSGFAIPKL